MAVDLSVNYLGLELKNPLVASASPLTGDVDSLQRLEQAGASAAVLPSLFEEQIEHEELELARLYDYQTDSFAESLTHFPELEEYSTGTGDYLRRLEKSKSVTSIPIIGSLNGASDGGWIRYAKEIESAGADALELNIYFVASNPLMTSADVEQRYIDLVAAVRQSVSVPLAVKIGPNFSSLPHFAQRLVEAGADGLVLFNRYLEADIDLESLQFKPDLVLSNRHEARVPLRWVAILRDLLPRTSLAATSGIHRMEGVVKLLLAGADVTMSASALLQKGPAFLGRLLEDVRVWLEDHEYQSVRQLQGSMSQRNCPDPSALERANYMRTLTSYTTQHPLAGQ